MVEKENNTKKAREARKITLHVDTRRFPAKPTRKEIGSIKCRMASPESILELTAEQIADRVVEGMSIEPGVCPLSEGSRNNGKKATVKEDFTRQEMFLIDIYNDVAGEPQDTPERMAKRFWGIILSLHSSIIPLVMLRARESSGLPWYRTKRSLTAVRVTGFK